MYMLVAHICVYVQYISSNSSTYTSSTFIIMYYSSQLSHMRCVFIKIHVFVYLRTYTHTLHCAAHMCMCTAYNNANVNYYCMMMIACTYVRINNSMYTHSRQYTCTCVHTYVRTIHVYVIDVVYHTFYVLSTSLQYRMYDTYVRVALDLYISIYALLHIQATHYCRSVKYSSVCNVSYCTHARISRSKIVSHVHMCAFGHVAGPPSKDYQ